MMNNNFKINNLLFFLFINYFEILKNFFENHLKYS